MSEVAMCIMEAMAFKKVGLVRPLLTATNVVIS